MPPVIKGLAGDEASVRVSALSVHVFGGCNCLRQFSGERDFSGLFHDACSTQLQYHSWFQIIDNQSYLFISKAVHDGLHGHDFAHIQHTDF